MNRSNYGSASMSYESAMQRSGALNRTRPILRPVKLGLSLGALWLVVTACTPSVLSVQEQLTVELCHASLERRLAIEADLARWVNIGDSPRALAQIDTGDETDAEREDRLRMSAWPGPVTRLANRYMASDERDRLQALLNETEADISTNCLEPAGVATPTPTMRLRNLIRDRQSNEE